MRSNSGFNDILVELIKVLDEEKEVLIKNEAFKLQKLVDRKNEIAIGIEKESKSWDSTNMEMRRLVGEVKRRQELNHMLTKQAMSFQEEIYRALSMNTSQKYNTYSRKGSMSVAADVSLVDQSV